MKGGDTVGTVKDRQEYVFVIECIQGVHPIGDGDRFGKRNRRYLIKILERWQEEGMINWYHVRTGHTSKTGDAFSYVECEDMKYHWDEEAQAGYWAKDKSKRGLGISKQYLHTEGTFIEVDFFVGYEYPERELTYRTDLVEKLPSLPDYDGRTLDHNYQGEKTPFAYTMIQRKIEDDREAELYRAQLTGEDFSIGAPDPEPVVERGRW
jgi:hypothetical protein